MDILAEVDSTMDVKQSLDEISREVDELKSRLTNTDDGNNGGHQTNAATGEIDKIRKIVELLETVVLPIVVDGQQNGPKSGQKLSPAASIASVTAVASEPIKIIPKGLRLLQHHSGIISDIEDGPQIAIEKALFQSDDN